MGDFTELRARIQTENRQVVQRRVYTVTGQQVPEEDIDRMIETGEVACLGWLLVTRQKASRVGRDAAGSAAQLCYLAVLIGMLRALLTL